MRIGIGLPAVLPGVPGEAMLEGARRAEVTFPTLPDVDQVDRLADVLLR